MGMLGSSLLYTSFRLASWALLNSGQRFYIAVSLSRQENTGTGTDSSVHFLNNVLKFFGYFFTDIKNHNKGCHMQRSDCILEPTA
jgi:hypothetical protein